MRFRISNHTGVQRPGSFLNVKIGLCQRVCEKKYVMFIIRSRLSRNKPQCATALKTNTERCCQVMSGTAVPHNFLTNSLEQSLSWEARRLSKVKGKVKVTLVQSLRLCTGRTAHRGSRGIALPFHDHGTRRGKGSASRLGHSLPPGKTRYPLYRRLGGP